MPRGAVLGLAVALGLAATAHAQTAEQAADANVAARGGLEAWRAVQSMTMIGLMDVGKGMQVPFTLQLKRPRKMRLDFLFDGQLVMQAYDGTQGWKRQPHLGRAGVEPLSEEEMESAAGQTDLDGPLVDFRAKGHQVELLGHEEVEGRDTLKLAVTLATGTTRHLYLDAETFLEVKVDGTRRGGGKDRPMETFFRDYRPVEGLLIPHTLESRLEGAPSSHKLVIESVELNPELPDALFTPPAS